MSSILLTWLNTEVNLSVKIKDLEKDFANGYLLGELLHKFNQLTNLDEFRDDNNQAVIRKNFDLLFEVLRNVGVKFNPNMARDIINEKPGVISNLLYEIRSNLEKKGVNPDNISLKKSSHFQEMYAPMKFRQEIPQYDRFESKHFMETLKRLTKSQQDIDLEKKLKKFEDFKIEQTQKIQQEIMEEEIKKKAALDENIKKHRNKNQRYHAFLQQFEEKGINNWKNNMLLAKEREMKDIAFELKQAQRMNKAIERGINHTINEYKRNVKKFEETFGYKKRKNKNKGSPDDLLNANDLSNISGSGNALDKSMNNQNLNSSEGYSFPEIDKRAEAIKDIIYNKVMINPQTKTERNRRRRKIIVEQSKAQLEIENRRREEQYISKLAKQSNQEKQLAYEDFRVKMCKDIIKDNRGLREEMYQKRKEQNIEFFKLNEDNFLKFHIDNYKREIEKEENRRKDLEISLKQKKRNVNSMECERLIQLMIDMTDQAYIYQQTNDSETIDPRVWREWTNIFINNKSVLEPDIIEEDQEVKATQSNVNDEEAPNEGKEENQMGNEEQKAEDQSTEKVQASNPSDKKENIKDDFDMSNFKSKYNNTFYSIFNPEAKCSKLDQILDECEFYDYVNFLGQWNTSIIPQEAFITITSQDLVFDYVPPSSNDQPAPGKKDNKGGKNINTKQGNQGKNENNFDDLIKDESPENLVIPKENIKNILFGDLIDILIEMKYEDENPTANSSNEQNKETLNALTKDNEENNLSNNNGHHHLTKDKDKKNNNIFSYVPLKIAIIGQDFSGKKTQAKILSENFPFKIYDIQQLAKKAMSMLNKPSSTNTFILSSRSTLNNANNTNNVNPSNPNPNNQADNIAQMRNEQALEEQKFQKIKELGQEIKDKLLKGEDIPDEIYAELLIEYIKIDFPPKEEYDVIDEIVKRMEQKERILEDIEINKEQKESRPNAFHKKEKELNDELMRISLEETRGFVVVNYPKTLNQAKILESKLSGFIPENDQPVNHTNQMKNLFSVILDKSPKLYPQVKLFQGGFDFIFYLDVPSNECMRRAVGRRIYINKQTKEKTIYHLEDNQPPTDSDICENLKKIDDASNYESSLVTRHIAFNNTIDQVVDFYQPFGFEEKELKSFEQINGNRDKDYVFQDILTYVNQLVEMNEKKEKEIYDKELEENSFEEEEDGDNISDNFEGGNAENIINIDEENIPDNKQEKDKDSNNKDKEKSKKQKDTNSPQRSKDKNEESPEELNENNEENKVLEENNNENKVVEELSEYDKYINKINEIKGLLNKDLSQILLKIWSKLFSNYVNECKSIFKFLRVQRDSISQNYNLICQKFIEFLKRPSKKQILLLDYQMKYNKFLDDYPDLKDEPQVKEEHHQDVDDLDDKIYEIIEIRKNEAVEERKKIMTSGWIENEMEKFYMALERLFQNEIDKFIGSMQIMRDYYHNLDNRPLIELPFTTIDIIKEESDPTPIEAFSESNDPNNENNQNSPNPSNNLPDLYPRIEKLYKNCLKIQFQYDEAIREAERNKQDPNSKDNAKSKNQPKPKDKKGANNAAQEEDKEVNYPHNEEMKTALANEKAKYKYKITLLKYWGISCLKNIRSISLSIYNKLEDWIILAIKAENEALSQLTNILKENIEKEEKIKYELALDTFDVIINMDVQNYIELPPTLLPAKEIIDHNKFNITQLKILIDELNTYIIDNNEQKKIHSSTFINIFLKKYVASKNDNDVYYGIPNLLKNLSFYNYFKFIKKLDPENTDTVSLKYICTYFALLNCPVPTDTDIDNVRKQYEFQNDNVDLNTFKGIKFWFDDLEKSETLPNHEDYQRDIKLKEVIFDINKNNSEADVISMNEFVEILSLTNVAERKAGKTYYEVLFF